MIKIIQKAFDPWQELATFQRKMKREGEFGACANFIGTMRDMNEGDAVNGMFLEHYPGMTEKHLEKIVQSAKKQWDLLETLVIHRVGALLPNDPIVLVAAWSVHRKDAFEASRFIMEDLKSKAPFWKKENLSSTALQAEKNRWVEKNTSGY
ncbi:molybdenum cofactor biosynthesis protein MoaE [Cycloclasticus pugetii]|uniref:molybdenum cofactor biosynthesis protein MoaE n=1 Tax=Cycloclasticus pugetii TaxID=34068 RepID=UPI0003738844|nr:molybdenum cofactor biosynthesis protein MoaE [Cycloclasticus pugetii]